jgi:hypothetical protein
VSSSGDRTAIGAATAGTDILNYHAFAASFTRWMDAEPGAPRLDWDVTYAYRRWRPMIVSTVSRETTFTREGTTSVVPGELWRQSTKVAVGVALPINSAQTSHLFIASLQRGKARLGTIRGERTAERAAFRSAWAFNSANVFGNSISPEGGILTGVTAELVRRALGSSADATTITGDARVYLPGLAPHHVVAVRAVGGSTRGNPLLGRMFLLGGPGPDLSTIDFDTDAVTLLRGFPSDSFRGSHVALVNADYRFPLWRIERGFGTWPLFAHTLHGAVFVDAGDTWIGAFKRSNLKRSYGAELAADLVVGYAARVTIAFGAAHGHDGSGRSADRTTWYARAGYAF